MHIHILGICGTFMGSMALLARELGYTVSGVDQQVYPPMSDQLRSAGIELLEGYDNHGLEKLKPDWVVVGNAMSRGNPAVEYMLDQGLRYCSGPEWLSREVLQGRHVLAVAGTHGKTTTSSMLAWILEFAGLNPGFLIGGVPQNFGASARLGGESGQQQYFVIEADEYDTAFFDKRSKFVHYRPRTLIMNNLEFDHADIFPDLQAIQRQFHHLLRTVPQSGSVLMPDQQSLREVLEMGLWSGLELLSGGQSPWLVGEEADDQSAFTVTCEVGAGQTESARIEWSLCGEHNLDNAIAAIAAARKVGVPMAVSAQALGQFVNVKRRQELLGEPGGVRLYDDFAHHPTAIETTLSGLRKKHPDSRLLAVIEPRSNTMKMGVHNDRLLKSLSAADSVYWYANAEDGGKLNPEVMFDNASFVQVFDDIEQIVDAVAGEANTGDTVVVMSNGGFAGIHGKLTKKLAQHAANRL